MRKTVWISTLSLALAMLMIAPLAHAKTRSIFLNGVDITGVRNQTFKEATVHIDHNGDVHLNAPKYKVEVVDDDEPTSAAASTGASQSAGANSELRTRYYLTTKPSPGGAAQYDFVVVVNGVERKIIPAGSKTIIMEISAWFKKGENIIEVVARKNLAGGRKSVSSSDVAELIIGAGHEQNNMVKVDVVHASVKCNASQITESKRRFTVNAI